MVSADIDNPWDDELIDFNANNLNNLANTMVMIFETLTLEGWSYQVKRLVDSGHIILAPSFFLLVISFGSYFMINLILAVIMGSFSKFENREIEQMVKQAENKELLRVSTLHYNKPQQEMKEEREESHHKMVV